ncbi:MAG: DNA primase large subunit PriL [Thermoplasmata archaeon]|nr:DNA primase large subunit PriL [Thermoplasmata archaeon]
MAVPGAPPLADRVRFGEFPFLPGAEAVAGELAGSLRELLEDPALGRARELGRARILAALDDPSGGAEITELDTAEPEVRFLSFQYARILLGAAAHRAPVRRWAVAEAKRAHARLRLAPEAELAEVARRLGFGFREEGAELVVPVFDYLRLATPIREAEFRLVRQPVGAGEVRLPAERASRILQEGIRRQLSEPLPLGAEAIREIREREGAFLDEVAERAPPPASRLAEGPLVAAAFPPCIRRMRRALDGGENLSHSGRFALAAFLHKVGANTDTIVDSFRGAPDFDEGVTRYQVEHITTRSGGEGYEPPECATLRSHGLCVWDGDPAAPKEEDRRADALCHEPWLRHPLQYYRRRSSGGGRPVERSAPQPREPSSP